MFGNCSYEHSRYTYFIWGHIYGFPWSISNIMSVATERKKTGMDHTWCLDSLEFDSGRVLSKRHPFTIHHWLDSPILLISWFQKLAAISYYLYLSSAIAFFGKCQRPWSGNLIYSYEIGSVRLPIYRSVKDSLRCVRTRKPSIWLIFPFWKKFGSYFMKHLSNTQIYYWI